MDFDFISNSPQQTIEFGRKLGEQLTGSEVVAVCGSLGSGKTHLIKGIAAGVGAKDEARLVNSPTFVIVNEYSALRRHSCGASATRLDIFHIDAYRLKTVSEFEMLGFDDFCYPQSVVLIEWADKIESALKGIDYIRIELVHTGTSERAIHIADAPKYITF